VINNIINFVDKNITLLSWFDLFIFVFGFGFMNSYMLCSYRDLRIKERK
jgi:ABC-type polysaccharide/polyol phosphate export permease